MEIIDLNILDSDAQYIAHSCNCITNKSAGLAKDIFNKFPYADIYLNRNHRDAIGTIKICGNGLDKRFVINMFSIYYPGGPKPYETEQMREDYFKSCLNKIEKIENIKSIDFPYKIQCGLAGGNWDHYFAMISNFQENNQHIKVRICKF